MKEKMSTDAVLLHDLSQYVNTGIPGSDNLAQRKIGPLNHSRWLTHATRIERLLLSTNPDEPFYSNLVLLATYITAIYFSGHMEVKYKPSITDSPAHFYNQISRQAQYFSGDLLKVLQKNLQTKSSSAHPDNILVGMVACDDPVRREGAVMMILKIRELQVHDKVPQRDRKTSNLHRLEREETARDRTTPSDEEDKRRTPQLRGYSLLF